VLVDLCPEKVKFALEVSIIDLNPPGFGAAVAPVGPAIAPRLEMILEVEGAVLGKDANSRPLACLVKFREWR
jgi:hypothetical protein